MRRVVVSYHDPPPISKYYQPHGSNRLISQTPGYQANSQYRMWPVSQTVSSSQPWGSQSVSQSGEQPAIFHCSWWWPVITVGRDGGTPSRGGSTWSCKEGGESLGELSEIMVRKIKWPWGRRWRQQGVGVGVGYGDWDGGAGWGGGGGEGWGGALMRRGKVAHSFHRYGA